MKPRKIKIQLFKNFKISAITMQEEITSLSNSINIRGVITQRMIQESKKILHDYKMGPRIKEREKILKIHYKKLMVEIHSIFYQRPHFEKICKQRDNQLVLSCFTEYEFKPISRDDDDDDDVNNNNNNNIKGLNDIKYIMNCCGQNLTYLDVKRYPFSQIMPLININCPGLKELFVEFQETNDKDFENVFSNMNRLEKLVVAWNCEKQTLPMTLVKSLEQVVETLKELWFSCESKNGIYLPDALALIFPRLIALKRLYVHGFRVNQTLIQSIGETKNLTDLELFPPYNYPMVYEKINVIPIGNLQNLKILSINWDWGCTDEFLINLGNNSKKLECLHIRGTNITDDGMNALNNLSQLDWFSLGLITLKKNNKYITDKSIQFLKNEKLVILNLSNCTKISNKSVIKIFENLPNLSSLSIENTNVTIKVIEELSELTKFHKEKLSVSVSFKDCKGISKSLIKSHNVEFFA